MTLNDKFKPLFTTDKRYIIITGGRGSSKSFSVSTFLTLLLYELGHRVLFTRYTLTSAQISIIPEFKEKLQLLGIENDYKILDKEIINIKTKSDILFRGIKTSEGIQTASLKSIQGITTWVVDEAEELPDEETFDKIDLSIREQGKRNIIILILNPTTREHWIWKKFFEKTHEIKTVDGYNVPMCTAENVCHIHTTYLDNLENLSESFLQLVETIKQEDKKKYAGEIIGGWKLQLDGTVFDRLSMKRFSRKDLKLHDAEGNKLYDSCYGYIDVADEGTDAYAFPLAYLFKNKIYLTDILFSKLNTDFTIPATVSIIKKHNPVWVRVEANNQGSVVIKELRKLVSPEKVLGVINVTKKHTRIILSYNFIKTYFYFLNDNEIEHGSDYDLFMRELFDYMKEEKENKGHDDAPDALSGLAQMSQNFLPDLFRPE